MPTNERDCTLLWDGHAAPHSSTGNALTFCWPGAVTLALSEPDTLLTQP
jgi:hypothetical protein